MQINFSRRKFHFLFLMSNFSCAKNRIVAARPTVFWWLFLFLHDRALAMRCYGSTNMSAKNVMTKREEVYAARDAKIFPSEP